MKRLQLDHRRIAVGVMSLVVAVAGLAVLSAQDDPLVKSEPLPTSSRAAERETVICETPTGSLERSI